MNFTRKNYLRLGKSNLAFIVAKHFSDHYNLASALSLRINDAYPMPATTLERTNSFHLHPSLRQFTLIDVATYT